MVQTGPYAVVRHPGCLASLVMWPGLGLCSGTWIVVTSIVLVIGFAYARRIAAEDVMLRRSLSDAYDAYAKQTARLIPAVC